MKAKCLRRFIPPTPGVVFSVILLIAVSVSCFGQISSGMKDSVMLREAIYSAKNGQHDKAKALCREILRENPGDNAAAILLGRVYSWDRQFDSARAALSPVLSRNPNDKMALEAMINVELWSDHPDKAMDYCNRALARYPGSESLMMKKAKIYVRQKKYEEAKQLDNQIISLHPDNREAQQLKEYLKGRHAAPVKKNRVGIYYQYDHFSNTYTPWSYASLYYARKGNLGGLWAGVNYAHRFNANGLEYELDLYPKISATTRAFIGGAYSKDTIFPAYRLGASLYQKLFRPLELEAGIRYLSFTNLPDPIIIYTGALSVSYQRIRASFRTYLTPQSAGGLNQAYYLTLRYYMHQPEKNITLILNSGLSPRDYTDPISGKAYNFPTKSQQIRIAYETPFLSLQNILKISAGYENRAYHLGASRGRISAGAGYERKF